MDAQKISTDQEIEGDQQPSELPILSEKDESQETSDYVPPLVLADLERDDPKFAFPVVLLVGLYRRLWESCVSNHIDGQKLEQDNLALKEAGTHLRKDMNCHQLHHDKQLPPAALFRAGTGIFSGTTD
ncbi:hypothetical protein PENFLA_c087G00657 [Penicillium flavigenum]|uniref:Uncharacterized protein n=1 Tax=Penicillium flavigenum TaxID=254877 RepID=A0A1V6S971_9EURO|nr:hypothetical protein PENFLA_c087G00657 [Penicillium flavigenum]